MHSRLIAWALLNSFLFNFDCWFWSSLFGWLEMSVEVDFVEVTQKSSFWVTLFWWVRTIPCETHIIRVAQEVGVKLETLGANPRLKSTEPLPWECEYLLLLIFFHWLIDIQLPFFSFFFCRRIYSQLNLITRMSTLTTKLLTIKLCVRIIWPAWYWPYSCYCPDLIIFILLPFGCGESSWASGKGFLLGFWVSILIFLMSYNFLEIQHSGSLDPLRLTIGFTVWWKHDNEYA